MKKNSRLFLIFFGLLVINALFWLIGGKPNSVSFDEALFAIKDTASVESIRLVDDSGKAIELARSQRGWLLNDEYPVDEGLRRLLLSILQRVQVRKPVQVEPIDPVRVIVEGSQPMNFSVWGNLTKTRTFFSLNNGDEVYEAGIPGYNEYLAAVFELNADQWRDRLFVDGSWRTIQRLTLDYLDSEVSDFTIRFEDQFFKIESVSELDSSAVVDYLNQFQFFEVNEWISAGRFPRYDSLVKMPPIATLTMETIRQRDPVVLDIFPRIGTEPFHLAADREENMMVIDKKRVDAILVKRKDFSSRD